MELTKQYLKDINFIAWQWHKQTGLDRNDLFQEASYGFLSAENKYKENMNATFLTYAHKCAENAVIDFVRREKKLKYISFEDIRMSAINTTQVTKYFGDVFNSLTDTTREILRNK